MSALEDRKTSFIERSRNLYKDFYDYSKVDYKNTETHVTIICPVHGEFSKRPSKHLKGQGCPSCSKELRSERSRKTTEEFVNQSIKVHGNSYDYSRTFYKKANLKVTIACPFHGEFRQIANNHLNGQGCPSCGTIRSAKSITSDWNEVKREFDILYDGFYSYENSSYKNKRTKIEIICPLHGSYSLTPEDHLNGKECKECSINKKKEKFLERATATHGDKYSYDLDQYEGSLSYIKIECPFHGEFNQRASRHMEGRGCPCCGIEQRKSPQTLTEEEMVNIEAVLYHIRISTSEGDVFDKIGITTKSIKERFNVLSKYGMTYSIVSEKKGTLFDCYTEESNLLDRFDKDRFKIKFLKNTSVGGWTECFEVGVIEKI